MNTLEYLRPARWKLLQFGALATVAAQLEAVVLVMLVPIAQSISNGEDDYEGSIAGIDLHIGVTAAVGFAGAALVLAFALNVWLSAIKARFLALKEREQRDSLFELFMGADWPFQASDRSGRLHTLAQYSNRAIVVLSSVMAGIKAGISLVMFLLISFVLDWRAAMGILLLGCGLFGVLRPLSRRVKKHNRWAASLGLEYGEDLNEYAAMAREVRIFGAWPAVHDRMDATSEKMTVARRKSTFLNGILAPAYQYFGMLTVVLAMYAASQLDSVNVSALGAIALLLLRSLSYGQQLTTSYQGMIDASAFLEKIEEAAIRYRDNQLPSGGAPLEPIRTLALEGVSYEYAGSDEPALDAVDLTLSMGTVVGIVGPSGSGKTTLAQVLLRLRQPTAGRMLVNGEEADTFSLASWHDNFSFLPQESRLFHGTVAENIAFLSRDIDRDRIVEAARGAGVHDVIMELPEGYDTPVGQTFHDLSGGQIQRIGIARVLARDTQVIVLDEPTSALDMHSEAWIQETLGALDRNVLLVVIAHRLSTLSICDRLVVMNHGRIESDGTLAEILEQNEFFRRAMELGTLELPA